MRTKLGQIDSELKLVCGTPVLAVTLRSHGSIHNLMLVPICGTVVTNMNELHRPLPVNGMADFDAILAPAEVS